MKIFIRIVILNLIIGSIIAFYFPYTFSQPLGEVQRVEWIFFIWVALSILSSLLWIGYMFYHWGTNEFSKKAIKTLWFWILLIGAMIYLSGPLAYYIIVYEMGKGLRDKIHNKKP